MGLELDESEGACSKPFFDLSEAGVALRMGFGFGMEAGKWQNNGGSVRITI